MTNQALYRRYRSQTFDELVGQEHIVRALRNAVIENRVGHAYLFTGPRGVGKTTMARLLAKAVNCLAAAELRPCGVCEMCVAVAEGRAVDVIELDAASHTSVDDAREIIERVQFRPSIARKKVYVIDEVHMLSTAAFNALLKTIEEPPDHALFIMATTEVHKVPATILSRCQRFNFRRHTSMATVVHLHTVAEAEGFALAPGAAEAIARAATGSMRDALSVMDQLMSYGERTIALERVQDLLGATAAQEVSALAVALLNTDVASAIQVIADVAGTGADLRQFTRDLVQYLRAMLLICAGAPADLIEGSDDERAQIIEHAQYAEIGTLTRWVRLFSELDHQLRTSSYGQLPLELAIVDAIMAPAVPQASAPRAMPVKTHNLATPAVPATPVAPQHAASAAAVTSAAADLVAPAVPATPVTPQHAASAAAVTSAAADLVAPVKTHNLASLAVPVTPPATPTPIATPVADAVAANADFASLEAVEAVWDHIVRDVRVFDKTLQALLKSGVRPVDVKNRELVLEAPNEWLLAQVQKPQVQQMIEKVIERHVPGGYQVRFIVQAQEREHANQLRDEIRTRRRDPLIKAALNIFDADIIAVERE